VQAAHRGRIRELCHLFHLFRREWLEILCDAHVLIQMAHRVAAQCRTGNGQSERVAQAFLHAQLTQQKCVCKNLDGLDANAALNSVRERVSLKAQVRRVGGVKRHQR